MFELNFRLTDGWDNYRYFDTVEEAKKWIISIGEEMFDYVDLSVGEELLEGFSEIVGYNK